MSDDSLAYVFAAYGSVMLVLAAWIAMIGAKINRLDRARPDVKPERGEAHADG